MKEKNKRILRFSFNEIFVFLVAVYGVSVVICNIFEMKTLGSKSFAIAGGGIFVSWIAFTIMDIITEIWGRKSATRVFTFAAIVNLIVVLLAQLIIFLPGTYEDQNAAFKQIFSNGPRTIFASTFAFFIGNFVNVFSMDKMKLKAKDQKNGVAFAFRAIVSSILGQLFDNFLFAILAFAPIGISVFEMGWMDILTSVMIGTVLEVLVESCFLPFVTRPICLKLLKKKEEEGVNLDENLHNGY